MPYTDSIRSKARKQAWYNDDPSIKTFNFFGRINPSPSRQRDVERDGRPLTLVTTENDAYSPVEAARREGYALNGDSSKRHGTFPSGPDSDRPRSRQDITETEKKDFGPTKQTTDSTTRVSTTTPTANDDAVGTRKRRRFHLPHLFGRKGEDEHDLNHTDTSESKKSKKRKHKKIPVMRQVKAVLASWINILLVFVPVGLGIEYSGVNGILSFVMNFIAIIPLASMLSFATEELAYYVGDTFGGLLNATFGNATELIVSIIALVQKKVIIVKTSLIGSILSNLLLVLGMCFLFGGINRMEQFFNITVAQTAASLLALAIGALVTPTAFRIFSDVDTGVQPLSHAASILLLLTYIAYLVFQLRTHIEMYNEPSQKAEKQNLLKRKPSDKNVGENVDVSRGMLDAGPSASAATGRFSSDKLEEKAQDDTMSNEGEEEHIPQLSATGALVTLAISTALIALTSDGMVSGIDAIPEDAISQEFIGLILVPIVGNAAEHATAVTVAIKDKMDLAIGVAVGSSLQIALLVIPLMVLIYWFGAGQPTDQPMDLNFDGFQVVVLFIAIILVNYVIQDGRSHWLEGVMLCITYMIFAVAAWYVSLVLLSYNY